MAKIKNGALGTTSGKLAHLVFFEKGGKTFVRLAPKKKQGTGTNKQVEARKKFALMKSFLSKTNGFIQKGFTSDSPKKITVATIEAFRVNLKNAFKGKGETLQIDYEKIVLTRGKLSAPSDLRVVLKGNELQLNWIVTNYDKSNRPEDRLSVLVFSLKNELLLQFDWIARREELLATLEIPQEILDTEMYLWAVFENQTKMGEVSTSIVFRID